MPNNVQRLQMELDELKQQFESEFNHDVKDFDELPKKITSSGIKLLMGQTRYNRLKTIYENYDVPETFSTKHSECCAQILSRSIKPNESKSGMNIFSNDSFYPKTYYSNDSLTDVDKTKLYFIKKSNSSGGKNIKVVSGNYLPNKCPIHYVVQEAIQPKLYNRKKFDLRVLCCMRGDGAVYLNTNFQYRVCKHNYVSTSVNQATQLTNNSIQRKVGNHKLEGFFYNDNIGAIDNDEYVRQVKNILPNIYRRIIDNYKHKLSDSQYYITGMDFIPDKNNILKFIEFNSHPGASQQVGFYNYRRFYNDVARFVNRQPVKFGELFNF